MPSPFDISRHRSDCPCRPGQEAQVWCETCQEHGSHDSSTHDAYHDMNNHCTHHGYEPMAGAFRVCGECWHAFMTEVELVEADAKWGFPPSLKSVGKIYSCPLCSHDF